MDARARERIRREAEDFMKKPVLVEGIEPDQKRLSIGTGVSFITSDQRPRGLSIGVGMSLIATGRRDLSNGEHLCPDLSRPRRGH